MVQNCVFSVISLCYGVDNTENVFFNFKSHDDMRMELDCQNLDSEFGLFGYKEEQKTTPDRPG